MDKAHRIGIIGGSYNPIHIAHLVIAEQFAEQMNLDQVWFVPAYRSPFKLGDDGAVLATPEQRLEMLRLAVERNPRFRVSDVELRREGISWTVDTVHHFASLFPQAELFLLIGGDQAAAFTRWRAWQEIASMVRLCIARRPFSMPPEVERGLVYHLTVDANKAPVWIDSPQMHISSTDIRQRLAAGRSVRYLVTEPVRQYIEAAGLYRLSDT